MRGSFRICRGGAAFPLQLGGSLKEWVEAPDVEGYRRADPRQIVAASLKHIERYALPEHVPEDYLSCYEGDRFVESMHYVRSYPTELPVLRDLLRAIETCVQMIAGARDHAVPPVNAEFLHQRLPKSRLAIVDAGHFTWGGRSGRVRGDRYELVERRLCNRGIYRSTLIELP